MRSTPWVDGCCGPMLTTMRSSWIGSPEPPSTASQSPPVTVKTRPSVVSRAVAYASVVTTRPLPLLARSSGQFGWRLRGSQAHSSRSSVRPPLVRRRNLRALVFDRYATERIVLPLRESLPVVRHEDPGQRRVPIEDHAEHVVRLALVPV